MTKKLFILLTFGLCGCSSVQLAPLDDAYYYPEKSTSSTVSGDLSVPSAPAVPATSSVEYVNVQDTTVTIRVKK